MYKIRKYISIISVLAGVILLVFPAAILLYSLLTFVIGYSINQFNLWIPLILTSFFALWGTKQFFKQNYIKITGYLLILLTIIVIFFGIVSGLIYDISYDGQTYHQEAIVTLANGWNPVYEMLTNDRAFSNILLNHYPRGSWIYESIVFYITDNIEIGKLFNLLFMQATFFIVLAALLQVKKISVFWAFCGAMLIMLNPVSIYQALSFYVDGQIATILTSMLATFFLLYIKWEKIYIIALGVEIILLCNIKFTGVVYCVISLIIFIWCLMKNKKPYLEKVIKFTFVFILISIIIPGINPYVKNTFYYGHPFYPLYGAEKNNMDIMTLNSPKIFLTMNRFQKMFYSIFSEVSNKVGDETITLKIPFSINMNELYPFIWGGDVRISGFGPWFSGAFLFSLIIFIVLIRQKNYDIKILYWLLGSILLTVFINPECWWARYAPQLWLLPIIIMLYIISLNQKNIIYGQILAVILSVNIFSISYLYCFGNIYTTKTIKKELLLFSKCDMPIYINFEEFFSNKARFNKNGVKYISVQNYTDNAGLEVVLPCDITYRYWRYNYLNAGKNAVLKNLGLKQY